MIDYRLPAGAAYIYSVYTNNICLEVGHGGLEGEANGGHTARGVVRKDDFDRASFIIAEQILSWNADLHF